MKVLHVFNESFSAIEFAAPLVELLRPAGIESSIACAGTSYPDARSYVDELRLRGIDVRIVPIPRVPSPLSLASPLWQLASLLRHEGFDLVHTHQSSAGILGRIAAYATRKPIVHTVYDYAFPDYEGIRRRVFLALERWAAARSARVLFISRSELEWAERYGIGEPDRRVEIGWGIDLQRFKPELATEEAVSEVATQYRIPRGGVIVGAISRLVPRKGWEVLLRSFPLILEAVPSAHLLVGGGGPDEARLRSLARTLGIAERTTFTGFIERRDDIPILHSLLDIFCLPTRREGYGMAFAEAAAMCRPVVGPAIQPIASLVEQGVSGLLVGGWDSELYAAAVVRLARDENLRSQMGAAGRQLASSKFDLKPKLLAIAGIYREVLEPS